MDLLRYEIIVEGQVWGETDDKKEALAWKREFEAEGWNVKLLVFKHTYIGWVGYQSF